MSSIKQNSGQCLDCPDGVTKALIAKRCQHHYWLYRESISEKKQTYNEWAVKKEPKKNQKPRKPIPPRSKKRKVQELQYLADIKIFLGKPENQKCPVTGMQTNQVHHKKGRIGELLLDQRYWLAVSDEGHIEIELNPEWAKEKGFSLSRLENIENITK